MHLLLDPISHPAIFALFDTERDIVARRELDIRGSESERFFESVLDFLSSQGLDISDLHGIVTVTGPGGFTSTRIVTLLVNTIAFVRHVPLFSLDYFELLRLAWAPYPHLIRANRGEYLIRSTASDSMRLVSLAEVPSGTYHGIGEENDFENARVSIQSSYDLATLVRSLDLTHPQDRIDPIYVKKPNIGTKNK